MFEYTAKSAKHREQAVAEDQVCAAVRSLKRRRGGGEKLLAYRNGQGWHDVTAAEINDYIREVSGSDYTAKDFRTWHATVLAAVGLAVSGHARSESARKGDLGKDSHFGDLATRGRAESAVLKLLALPSLPEFGFRQRRLE
jgi:DNA topoisomerase IB